MNYLKHGGRLLDTAQVYGNEREIGTAVKQSGIPREEIWVNTKIWPAGLPAVAATSTHLVPRVLTEPLAVATCVGRPVSSS